MTSPKMIAFGDFSDGKPASTTDVVVLPTTVKEIDTQSGKRFEYQLETPLQVTVPAKQPYTKELTHLRSKIKLEAKDNKPMSAQAKQWLIEGKSFITL